MSVFGVYSEVGQLRKVIVHRPDASLEHVTCTNQKPSQSEDALWAKKAGEEHDIFVSLLRDQNVEILYLDSLLEQTLSYPDARDWLLDRRIQPVRMGPSLSRDIREWLDEVPSKILTDILTGGITFARLPFKTDDPVATALDPDAFVLPPLPNQMFTQDASSWIYNGVSLNPIGPCARKGESDNVAAVYHFHPSFEEALINIWWGLDKDLYGNVSLQGSDVMVLGHGIVAIAMGSHTTSRAVSELASALLSRAEVEEVIAIKMPPRFAQSRFDFAFNMCSPDLALVCKPITDGITCYSIRMSNETNKLVIEKLRQHLVEVMRRALRLKKLRTIDIDGCNGITSDSRSQNASVLVIKPGIVASYASETETNALLGAAGVDVLPFETSELSRSGGGPRRLACAVLRGPLLN